jgi:hypothetical protein
MKIQNVFKEIGKERGIPVREEGEFLLGTIEGFPICIAVGPLRASEAVYITIRTGEGDFGALKKAIRGKKGVRASRLTSPGGSGFLQYVVPIGFSRRVKKAVVVVLDALMPVVLAHFRAPAAACEVCNKPGVENLVVDEGVPIRICLPCVQEIMVKQEAARAAYEATSPDYLMGFILGLVGAAAGALGWAIVAVLLEKVHSIVAALVGVAVAFFVKKGMGRVNRVGYVITAILVLMAVFTGEVMALAWPVFKKTGSIDLVTAVRMYLDIATNSPRALIVALLALVGAWAGAAYLEKMESDAMMRGTVQSGFEKREVSPRAGRTELRRRGR